MPPAPVKILAVLAVLNQKVALPSPLFFTRPLCWVILRQRYLAFPASTFLQTFLSAFLPHVTLAAHDLGMSSHLALLFRF